MVDENIQTNEREVQFHRDQDVKINYLKRVARRQAPPPKELLEGLPENGFIPLTGQPAITATSNTMKKAGSKASVATSTAVQFDETEELSTMDTEDFIKIAEDFASSEFLRALDE
jgi:hypothetical protein